MALRFNPAAKERVKEAHRAWWAGTLGRPLVQVRLQTEDPWPDGVPSYRPFTASYSPALEADSIVLSWRAHLEDQVFLGDGFPHIWPNFGPGVAAAFLGARLEADEHTVWFHPEQPVEIGALSFAYDPDNRWLTRVRDIVRTADAQLDPCVTIGHTDLGGAMDILSTFRPGTGLPLDLIDAPDRVDTLEGELLELWWSYYREFAACGAARRGYSCWTPLLSETPYYMLQSDFSYMIGPDMFGKFVRPRLVESCVRLENAFYHLDGVGQLPHLDPLLSIERLRGVQWIPGDGHPPFFAWPEVYARILAAGKRSQVFGDLDTLRAFADRIDGFEKIAFVLEIPASEEREALNVLDQLGVPAGGSVAT
jgi:5-methyltetrahydrofolate--homocysteine methyltransferase